MLEPGNAASTLPPVMMFVFADNRYFSTWNEDYACEWVGQITVEGVDTMNDPSLWLGYAISLQMLETDCYDMDPWVWGEPTPTTMMEQGFFGLGYGPSSAAMKDSLQDLIELSGDDWATNWAPYIFSMYVGLWDDATSQLAAHEVAFTMSYKMEDGALTSTLDEEPEPVPLSDGGQPPHGLLIGYSWFDLEPSALL